MIALLHSKDPVYVREAAKRYGVEPHFSDREFKVTMKGRKPPCVPVLDTSPKPCAAHDNFACRECGAVCDCGGPMVVVKKVEAA